MDAPLIDVRSLHRGFGATQVLRGLDLQVGPGTVYGLVGRNGAGKTTLIRLLLGLLRPDSGAVSVAGRDPWRHEPSCHRAVGAVLEHDGFLGNLTFGQNMAFYADARGVGRAELAQYLREHWGGCELAGSPQKARYYSRGQRMQGALCRAFLGWPRVCILDEPTVGLDIDSYDHFCALVREARSRGTAVVVSSHQLSAVEELCDMVGLLEAGILRPVALRGQGRERWFVAVAEGGDEAVRTMVALAGGAVLEHDDGWRIEVSNPSQTIPALVAALVGAGMRVREVRPDAPDLRQAIRGSAERSAGTGDRTP